MQHITHVYDSLFMIVSKFIVHFKKVHKFVYRQNIILVEQKVIAVKDCVV